jgi:hypothetical protein
LEVEMKTEEQSMPTLLRMAAAEDSELCTRDASCCVKAVFRDWEICLEKMPTKARTLTAFEGFQLVEG